MGKIGSSVKIDLINAGGISMALTNEFKNEMEFKMAIYNCIRDAEELSKVLKNHDKFEQKWQIEYEDEKLMIFKHEDAWGNLRYLHLTFNTNN